VIPRTPKQAELRRAEAATWGEPPAQSPGVLLPIVASNLRRIDKNTLVGSVDITVTKWRFVFRGCLWHRKGEREWLNFPAREWTDENGARKFANLGEFINHGDARRFQEAALAAVHGVAGADR
jgi:hypothetical protein